MALSLRSGALSCGNVAQKQGCASSITPAFANISSVTSTVSQVAYPTSNPTTNTYMYIEVDETELLITTCTGESYTGDDVWQQALTLQREGIIDFENGNPVL